MPIRTRIGCLLALLAATLVMSSGPAAAAVRGPGQPDSPPADRLRTLDGTLSSALKQGLDQSPTIASLVRQINGSDLIVHLGLGSCVGNHIRCVVSVHRQGLVRYVRINFVLVQGAATTALWGSRWVLVAEVGHELPHALEIARDPAIVNMGSLDRAYRQRGAYHHAGRYETNAAMRVGELVLKELQVHRRPQRQARESALNERRRAGAQEVNLAFAHVRR